MEFIFKMKSFGLYPDKELEKEMKLSVFTNNKKGREKRDLIKAQLLGRKEGRKQATSDILEMIEEENGNIKESPTYLKILEHRKNCQKWGKEFCIECFGMGLTKCREDFLEELKQKIKGVKGE